MASLVECLGSNRPSINVWKRSDEIDILDVHCARAMFDTGQMLMQVLMDEVTLLVVKWW